MLLLSGAIPLWTSRVRALYFYVSRSDLILLTALRGSLYTVFSLEQSTALFYGLFLGQMRLRDHERARFSEISRRLQAEAPTGVPALAFKDTAALLVSLTEPRTQLSARDVEITNQLPSAHALIQRALVSDSPIPRTTPLATTAPFHLTRTTSPVAGPSRSAPSRLASTSPILVDGVIAAVPTEDSLELDDNGAPIINAAGLDGKTANGSDTDDSDDDTYDPDHPSAQALSSSSSSAEDSDGEYSDEAVGIDEEAHTAA